MKKIALALILSTMLAGSALAVTQDITVSASVKGTCKINSGPASILLGELDPLTGTGASNTAGLEFWCTKGTAYTVSDNIVTHELTHATLPAEKISYTFAITDYTGAGTGPGAPETLTATATVANDSFNNNAAGAYSQVVTVTIAPTP